MSIRATVLLVSALVMTSSAFAAQQPCERKDGALYCAGDSVYQWVRSSDVVNLEDIKGQIDGVHDDAPTASVQWKSSYVSEELKWLGFDNVCIENFCAGDKVFGSAGMEYEIVAIFPELASRNGNLLVMPLKGDKNPMVVMSSYMYESKGCYNKVCVGDQVLHSNYNGQMPGKVVGVQSTKDMDATDDIMGIFEIEDYMVRAQLNEKKTPLKDETMGKVFRVKKPSAEFDQDAKGMEFDSYRASSTKLLNPYWEKKKQNLGPSLKSKRGNSVWFLKTK